MARKWKVIEVLRQGSLYGSLAGQTIRLLVDFPWGVEEREFAPTMTDEEIQRTLDSFVESYTDDPAARDRPAVSAKNLNKE